MKQKIIDLLELSFDIEQFYCINLWRNQIKLQGHLTLSLLKELTNLGYVFNYDAQNNWLQSTKDDIQITLTIQN